MITIYRNNGSEVLQLDNIMSGSTLSCQLQDHDYITLFFNLTKPVFFKLGDYVDTSFGRYVLTDLYLPKININTFGYEYQLRLDKYYYEWKNKILKYRPSLSANETSFNLTATIDIHSQIILDNLRSLGFTYYENGEDYVVDFSQVGTAKAKLVTYDSISIVDALTAIATAFGCEWWVIGKTIYFGKCESNNAQITLSIGKELVDMSENASGEKYATRVFAYGSSRNIPNGYYSQASSDTTKAAVVQERLMLPTNAVLQTYGTAEDRALLANNGLTLSDKGYVQVIGIPEAEIVEEVETYDEVYPKTDCIVGAVYHYDSTVSNDDGTTTTQRFYQVTDSNGLNITDDMIIEGKSLQIKFTSGPLNGMTFDCEQKYKNVNGTNVKVYEVVVNEDYGRPLPDSYLNPVVGNKYILLNWDSTKIANTHLIEKASIELLKEVVEHINQSKIDSRNYTSTISSEYAYNNGSQRLLSLGDKVKLINSAYFENGRDSRVIGYEIKLDIPYDSPKYTFGNKISVSQKEQLKNNIEKITFDGYSYFGAGLGLDFPVIRTYDGTKPTDKNVFSALKVSNDYISKNWFDNFFVLHGKNQQGNDVIIPKDADLTNYTDISIEFLHGAWTRSYLSALGQNPNSGGGGASYNRLDSWASYDASKAGWVLSALLGNDLNSRVTSLENGQIEGVATQEWVQQQGYLTELSAATINALGAIKIGYSGNGKNYPVLLDNNNRAYVSVPWSDTTYGVFGASANGLVPMASASNKIEAEAAVGNYYLCADGKFRLLPANAFKNDNTWTAWKGATSTAAGTAGYMPAPTSAQRTQFLRGDGTWVSLNNYTLPTASADTLGGVKVGTTLAIANGVLNLHTTGVTAGTYKRVTVDAYGRVTSGDNTDTDTNTWRNIYVGGTSKVGTGIDTKAINFKAGSNVSLSFAAAGTGSGQSGNANYFDVVISATDTTYSAATQSAAGLMSAADKKKLDGIAEGANKYSLPLAASGTRGGIQLGYTQSGKNYPVQLSGEKAYVNVPWSDTTYSFVDANPTLAWGTKSKVATVGGVDIHVTMPANPNTWRPLGTGATDACAGNDARLSNARPASDVYAWAKASTKPTYTLDEVADGSSRKLANYLPLSGGTISNASFGKFIIERSGSVNMAAIGFKNNYGMLGYLGVNTVNGYFVRYKADTSAFYTILDSANSSVSLSGSTLTVKINGTEKSLANTWRGIQDNLTSSTNTTESLSAKQGYLLANGSARDNTKLPLAGGTMSNTNVVTNLNADLLDGLHLNRVVGTYTREQIGTSPNFDNPSIQNGLFEMRVTYETTGETGTKPFNDFAPFLTLKVQHVMMQLCGTNGDGWFIRGKQSANVTMENTAWQQLARTTDNVASATKLATSRTINGTSFDGSANITTANWGTARNISIADSDSTNTGSAVSVNGSAAVTLKLPATIKATLSGNAASATKLATPRTIWGQSFNGSANVSGAMTGVTNVDSLLYFDTVNGNGRVGIGTSTPDFPLSVYGNIATHFWVDSRAIVIEDGRQTAGYQKIEFNRGGAEDLGGIHWFHDQFGGYSFNINCINIVANNGYVTLGAWNAPALLVTPTNNVGIGTTSPNYKLDVAGVIHSSVGMFSDGYVSALGQNTSSDERLKDIKGDINVSIDVLANAPSKLFEWKSNKSLGAQVGTIAQYWHEALPQVVHDRGDGYLSMQYDVAALLGTITIAKRVQNHEERIKELERENEALREQLKEFKG